MLNEKPPFTFPPDIAYPVQLAIYHFNSNGEETPVSGDMKGMPWEDRKARRDLELEHYYPNT